VDTALLSIRLLGEIRQLEQRREARPPDSRRDREPPCVVAKLGWRYHHIGVPTQILDAALQGHEIFYAHIPLGGSPLVIDLKGDVRCGLSAMIIRNGAPVELIAFRKASSA